jgi:hypothetical protein
MSREWKNRMADIYNQLPPDSEYEGSYIKLSMEYIRLQKAVQAAAANCTDEQSKMLAAARRVLSHDWLRSHRPLTGPVIVDKLVTELERAERYLE